MLIFKVCRFDSKNILCHHKVKNITKKNDQTFLKLTYIKNTNRYGLHLSDVYNLVEITNKGTVTYYIDFVFEISVILIDLLHYLHMLVRFAI